LLGVASRHQPLPAFDADLRAQHQLLVRDHPAFLRLAVVVFGLIRDFEDVLFKGIDAPRARAREGVAKLCNEQTLDIATKDGAMETCICRSDVVVVSGLTSATALRALALVRRPKRPCE
jgi:hypothetical protein